MTLREECIDAFFKASAKLDILEDEQAAIDIIEAFAKRQRAAGLREAHDHLSHWFKHGETDVEDEIDWCEAKAKEYET